LVSVFEGNFKGTYIRPGNSWDLSKCKQKSGETLREYARRFSKQRTELPHIPDHNVILAFVLGTTSRDLVRELGRNRPQTVDELMDVVANYATGEQTVGAFFNCEVGKASRQPMTMRAPVEDPRRTRRRRKHDRSNGRPSTTTSSPPWIVKDREAPLKELSSTRC